MENEDDDGKQENPIKNDTKNSNDTMENEDDDGKQVNPIKNDTKNSNDTMENEDDDGKQGNIINSEEKNDDDVKEKTIENGKRKRTRVTPSIQNVQVQDEEEEQMNGEGSYMEFIKKQVHQHTNAICQAGKRMKENPNSVLMDALMATQEDAKELYLDPQIFGSPEESPEEQLDDEHEISLEIIADTDKEEENEEKEEITVGHPEWMQEMKRKMDDIQKAHQMQKEDDNSPELLTDTHSEVDVDHDSEWNPESEIDNDDDHNSNVSDSQEDEQEEPVALILE